MTQENKELLLKDLSSRLPYGVKCQITDTNDESFVRSGKLLEIKNIDADAKGTTFLFFNEHVPCYIDITEIKPYLRPMSSMTEEEKEEFHKLDFRHVAYSTNLQCALSIDEIDWLNKKGFDYRGLIERNLALDATDSMYNLNKK